MDQKKKIIKIIRENRMNPKTQQLMQQKLYNLQYQIEMEELPFFADAVKQNGQFDYQRWRVDFKGREYITMPVSKLVKVDGKLEKQMVQQNFPSAFKDKCISGILNFPNDYPNSAPTFTFDLINGETLQHHNIHGGGSFCVPPFINWDVYCIHISEIQILQTIAQHFHTPIVENSLNEMFSTKDYDEQYQIQLKQAQYLEDYDL